MSTTKQMVDAQAKLWNEWSHARKHIIPGWKLEVILKENANLKSQLKRLEGRYGVAQDQLTNLLQILDDNEIVVNSQDIIHGRKK